MLMRTPYATMYVTYAYARQHETMNVTLGVVTQGVLGVVTQGVAPYASSCVMPCEEGLNVTPSVGPNEGPSEVVRRQMRLRG